MDFGMQNFADTWNFPNRLSHYSKSNKWKVMCEVAKCVSETKMYINIY